MVCKATQLDPDYVAAPEDYLERGARLQEAFSEIMGDLVYRDEDDE